MKSDSIFLSYSRADSAFALKLTSDLKEAGIEIWMDQSDIKAGSRWDKSIEVALNSSKAMLVVLSPASVNSPNVLDEVSYVLEINKPVIPLFLSECDIPFRLRRLQRIDFSKGYYRGLNELISLVKQTNGDPVPPRPKKQERKFSKKYWLYGSLGFIACLVSFYFWSMPRTDEKEFVKIGSQKWMAKNLDVEVYRNGDTIPQVTEVDQWNNLTTGAWCYYNNDPNNGAIYGKLYNWFAVNDPRGLAPKKWHVPTDAEWNSLIEFLGGKGEAGGKLKAVSGLWNQPNEGASNASGFFALPSGYRYENGNFISLGHEGIWWAFGPVESRYNVFSNNAILVSGWNDKKVGFAVRCIRD